MANTSWNPSDKTANVTLSNLNLTAVTSANSQSVRAIDKQITGKFYFEVTCTTIGANMGVGLLAGYPALVAGGIAGTIMIVSGGGLIYLNGTSTGITIGTITNGTLLGLAFDITNQLAWFRVGAAGNWNGNAGYAPNTGVGGVNFAVLGGAAIPYYPYAAINNSGSSITANFGDTTFTGAVPAGFTSGFTSGASPPVNELLTQIAIEEWALGVTHDLQLTQIAIEEWALGVTHDLQVTQMAIEQWATVQITTPQVALTQIAIEEWASVLLIPDSVGAPMITMIG